MLLGLLLLALPSARAATFPWEQCGDWLGPVWFVVARPDTGHGRTYGTFRCQSLSFGALPCRAALAVGKMGVVFVRSNGTFFYQLKSMRSGTTESILTFVTRETGGTLYRPSAQPTPTTIDGIATRPGALLSSWLREERAAGHLPAGLEVHTWACPGGTPVGALDLSPLGLIHVPHQDDPQEIGVGAP